MKKMLMIIVAAMGIALSLHARTNIQFEQYVQLTKDSPVNPQGMTVSSDSKYRIIYIAMPIAARRADVINHTSEMKKGMLAELRKQSADCKIIKDLKINMVYNFITTDNNIVAIVISYQDL